MSNDQVLATFDHHTPSPEQVTRIQLNRQSMKAAAAVVLSTCPPGPDRERAYLRQQRAT